MEKNLVVPEDAALDWNFIKEHFAAGCPDKEFALLMARSKAKNLNPLKDEVYYVKTWTNKEGRFVWGERIAIDSLRKRGFASGEIQAIQRHYDPIKKEATVKLWKKGCTIPFEETVSLSEFIPIDKSGAPMGQWGKMEGQMLKKCCEATVLRMAFPDILSHLYIPEEMPESIRGTKAGGLDDGAPVQIQHEAETQPTASLKLPEYITDQQTKAIFDITKLHGLNLIETKIFLHWQIGVHPEEDVAYSDAGDFIEKFSKPENVKELREQIRIFQESRKPKAVESQNPTAPMPSNIKPDLITDAQVKAVFSIVTPYNLGVSETKAFLYWLFGVKSSKEIIRPAADKFLEMYGQGKGKDELEKKIKDYQGLMMQKAVKEIKKDAADFYNFAIASEKIKTAAELESWFAEVQKKVDTMLPTDFQLLEAIRERVEKRIVGVK